jgi:peptide/nickel transport system ATP-binding protein
MEGFPLLQIRDLSVDFITDHGSQQALNNVSFELFKGETLAIVGESGSGKSVTSLSILQLVPSPPALYKSGSILFSADGEKQVNLQESDGEVLRSIRGNDIAMIFQEPMTSLNPVITCGEQIAEAIRAHHKMDHENLRKRTIQLLEKVKLPEPSVMYDRYPHQLSGGQKQRIMIAMAMSNDPSLLICDEPTTALDVTVQKSILELIKDLQQQEGMGVIFISHDLGLVADIADRIAVMYKGRIVEINNASEIYNNPQHPYTKALLACRPALHPKGEPLPVVSDFMKTGSEDKKKDSETPGSTTTQQLIHPSASQNFSIEDPILAVENLSVAYGHFKAVDSVSFEISRGETIGLVGESGCGKTTLGRSVLRLIEPSEGKIIFEGIDITHLTEKDIRSSRKKMQIIFQDPYSSLNPRIRIGNALNEVLQIHSKLDNRQRKQKVMELLVRVGLMESHYDRYPHEFSGGQRQRIVIARALILEPSFVICDESVSALDVSVQAQVLNLLNELKADFGFAALFISHDLSVVRYISDRILVMKQGMIVEQGNSEMVYNNPEHPYTRQLLDAIPGV